MQVGTTKDQGLYNKPSAAVRPGVLAAGTLPQYSILYIRWGGECAASRLLRFTPGKELSFPCDRRPIGLHGRSRLCGEKKVFCYYLLRFNVELLLFKRFV